MKVMREKEEGLRIEEEEMKLRGEGELMGKRK